MGNTPRFRFRIDEESRPFLEKCFGGEIPAHRVNTTRRSGTQSIFVSAKKVFRYGTDMRLEAWDGEVTFDGKRIWFEYEIPMLYVVPSHINFSSHRTISGRKAAGSGQRRPMHGWSKRKKKHYLGGRASSVILPGHHA